MSDFPIFLTSPPQVQKDNLTFGVELEFAVATIPLHGVDPHPHDCRQVIGLGSGSERLRYDNMKSHIVQTLHRANIFAEAGTISTTTINKHAWLIKTDSTIRSPDDGGKYQWYAIEICSPPFYYSLQALHEVGLVCQVLKDTYRISVNQSCGTHVHVGNANKGFQFETIRRLMATVFTFEEQFESIHPKHRRENVKMCPSLRRSSELRRNNMEGNNLDLDAALNDLIIMDADFAQLEDLLAPGSSSQQGGSRGAYFVGDVAGQFELGGPGNKRTIEFRQHKGTLDFEELELWIKFCVQLVMFADEVPSRTLFPFLRKHISDGVNKFPLEQVLGKLGMPLLAWAYGRKNSDGEWDGE